MTVSPHRAGRRPAAIVVTVMLLLVLAVGQSFSVGGTHHGFGGAVAVPAAATLQTSCGHDHTDDHAPSPEHQHGDAWTSAGAPRPRLSGDAVGVIVPPLPAPPALVSVVAPATVAATFPDADPARLGVLRV